MTKILATREYNFWTYKGLSQSTDAMIDGIKAFSHMPDRVIDYPETDGYHHQSAPEVIHQTWKSPGLGSRQRFSGDVDLNWKAQLDLWASRGYDPLHPACCHYVYCPRLSVMALHSQTSRGRCKKCETSGIR